MSCVSVQPVLDRITVVERRRPFALVGIGGRGAAGKTSLAHSIPEAHVVGTDEFWNGSEFELSRLRREVFDALLRGERAVYAGFNWAHQERFVEPRVVEPRGLIVIDGVCALHRMFRDDYDLRIWVEAPYPVRLARGVARDGEASRRTWEEVWIPMEEHYIARDDPISAADLVVDGTRLECEQTARD